MENVSWHALHVTPRYAYIMVRSLMGLRTFKHQDLKTIQPLTCMQCMKIMTLGRASFKDDNDMRTMSFLTMKLTSDDWEAWLEHANWSDVSSFCTLFNSLHTL